MEKNELSQWTSDFGDMYRDRNKIEPTVVMQSAKVFRRIFEEASIVHQVSSVLEVGCNVGINLAALRQLEPDPHKLELSGIEPNPATHRIAKNNESLKLREIQCCDCYNMPFSDKTFDLVFTSGVLIHVPPARLSAAITEMFRVSKRFLLCAEYFSNSPETISYHGKSDMLWKRDFGALMLDELKGLSVRKYGFVWNREFPHFDNLNWWVFEKTEK